MPLTAYISVPSGWAQMPGASQAQRVWARPGRKLLLPYTSARTHQVDGACIQSSMVGNHAVTNTKGLGVSAVANQDPRSQLEK